jgi:hypothetical protein
VSFVHARLAPALNKDLATAGALAGGDAIQLAGPLQAVATEAAPEALAGKMDSLLNAVDARLTQRQVARGDVADIQQMVRWQWDLFRTVPTLARSSCAAKVVEASGDFLKARSAGKVTNAAYPRLLGEVGPCLAAAAGAKAPGPLTGKTLTDLEGRHRDYLTVLAGL